MKKIRLIGILFVLFSLMSSECAFAWRGGAYGGGYRGGWGGGYRGGWGGGYRGGWGGGYYGGWGGGFYPGIGYGVGFGGPFYSSWNYPATVVVPVQTTPPVYIQQTPVQSNTLPANFWYYCSNPKGYYPYVRTCPGGWQQVAPTPSSQ
jgi:hypothetical protein